MGIGACYTSPGDCREGRSSPRPPFPSRGKGEPGPMATPGRGAAAGSCSRPQRRAAGPCAARGRCAPLRAVRLLRRPSWSCSFPRPHPCGAGRDGLSRAPGCVARGSAGIRTEHRADSVSAAGAGKCGAGRWPAGRSTAPGLPASPSPGGPGRAGGSCGPCAAAKAELRGIASVCHGNIAAPKWCLSLFRAVSFFTKPL